MNELFVWLKSEFIGDFSGELIYIFIGVAPNFDWLDAIMPVAIMGILDYSFYSNFGF